MPTDQADSGECVGKSANDATSDVWNVIRGKQELTVAEQNLRENKALATVAFFDMVGSTEYRRERGAEAGIIKAYRHNIKASECIEKNGGFVVKWMGDGVLGCFYDDREISRHAYRAFLAALDTIDALKEYNEQLGSQSDAQVWDQIHTKIGISSGPVHFLGKDNADEGAERSSDSLDPIGTAVDLAARLQALAGPGVILVDRDTFFGYEPKDSNDKPYGEIEGICATDEPEIPWRTLHLTEARSTVYVVQSAPFFAETEGLTASRIDVPIQKIGIDELTRLGRQERPKRNNGKAVRLVFGSQPIPCNIRGFAEPVYAIAISYEPRVAPIAHEERQPRRFDDLQDNLDEGERLFRSGEDDRAMVCFKRVLDRDTRDFRANVRMAQMSRRARKNDEAMGHLQTAKEANARCELVWKLAGMIHLDNYLVQDSVDTLDRAATAFARAKVLASENFDAQIEQCSTGLLAIVYFLRNDERDNERAAGLVEELENWPPQTVMVQFMRPLLAAFAHLATGDSQGVEKAKECLDQAHALFTKASEADDDHQILRAGIVLEEHDLQLMMTKLENRIAVARVVG